MSELSDNQAAFEAAKPGYGFAKLPSGHYLYEGVQVMFNDWLENNELRKAKAKITELQAEVEALRKDTAWQPIETAPKDGTPVLIFGGIQHPEVGSSRTITRATLANWSTSSECWLVLDCDYYSVSIENPTHWMPLPKSPTAIAKDTQE